MNTAPHRQNLINTLRELVAVLPPGVHRTNVEYLIGEIPKLDDATFKLVFLETMSILVERIFAVE